MKNSDIYIFSIGIGIVVGIVVVMFLFWFCFGKLFQKVGRDRWESIIPIYNFYVLYKILKIPFILFFLNLIFYFYSNDRMFGGICMCVMAIYNIYFTYKVCKAFNKGFLFGLLTYFMLPVAFLVLGYGSSKYVYSIENSGDN